MPRGEWSGKLLGYFAFCCFLKSHGEVGALSAHDPEPIRTPRDASVLQVCNQIPKPEQETLLRLVAAMRFSSITDLIQFTLRADRLLAEVGMG